MTCTLYRFYDQQDRLLYVGISECGPGRWTEHRRHKPWWADVTRSTMTTYGNRQDAALAETTAIINEGPLYNIIHNRRPRQVTAPAIPTITATAAPLTLLPLAWPPSEDERLWHRNRSRVMPSGGRLTIRKAGQGWITLDVDRWPTTDFTTTAAQAGAALAEPLALLYACATSRAAVVSQFTTIGMLYAPPGHTHLLLKALFALDDGVAGQAQNLTPAIMATVAPLRDRESGSMGARRRAARDVVDQMRVKAGIL